MVGRKTAILLYEKLNRERYGSFDGCRIGCHWRENIIVRMVAACFFELSAFTYKTTHVTTQKIKI
jgi:hypothetical protein